MGRATDLHALAVEWLACRGAGRAETYRAISVARYVTDDGRPGLHLELHVSLQVGNAVVVSPFLWAGPLNPDQSETAWLLEALHDLANYHRIGSPAQQSLWARP